MFPLSKKFEKEHSHSLSFSLLFLIHFSFSLFPRVTKALLLFTNERVMHVFRDNARLHNGLYPNALRVVLSLVCHFF